MLKKLLLEFVVPCVGGSRSVRIIESSDGLYLEIYDYEHRSWKSYDSIGGSIPRWTEALLRLYLKSLKDTEMLDWLDENVRGYGKGWICRDLTTDIDRGLMIHEISNISTKPTIRAAITAAMGKGL